LKEQGKLEEPATRIHESMLTPKHDKGYIPQQPLLQNRAALAAPYPQTQRVRHVAGSQHASFAGNRREVPRTTNFEYLNCLGAYPHNSAGGLETCEDPLAFCPQPEAELKTMTQPAPPLLSSRGETSTPSLKTGFISQGDMLVRSAGGPLAANDSTQCSIPLSAIPSTISSHLLMCSIAMQEARLLGLSQSQMNTQCMKGDPVQQLQIANASFVGEH